LGTGGGIPSVTRGLPSIALNFLGELILFDCGESTQRQMMKAGVGFKRKFKIFLTHLHGDHVLGLPGLLYTLSMLDRRDPILIIGPPGTREYVKMFEATRYGRVSFQIYVREVSGEGVVDEGRNYVVEALRVDHTVESYAYRFREKERVGKMNVEYLESIGLPRGPLWGKLQRGESVEWMGKVIRPEDAVGPPRPGRIIVYTGDTAPNDRIAEFAKDADVLIHDSTFDSSYEKEALEQGHSTARQAALIARKAGVKRLYLFHLSPRFEKNPRKLLEEALEIFPESYLAEDLLSYEVPYKV
ncbi:MAG: ribonuclease Z, partial [Nitrososphaerota archaeon]